MRITTAAVCKRRFAVSASITFITIKSSENAQEIGELALTPIDAGQRYGSAIEL